MPFLSRLLAVEAREAARRQAIGKFSLTNLWFVNDYIPGGDNRQECQTVDKARFNKGKRAISMSRREKYEATRPRAS